MTSTMHDTGLFTVNSQLASAAGAVVWWRLSGSLDLDKLGAAWRKAGMDEGLLPTPPSPKSALTRAAASLRDAKVLVRTMSDGRLAIVDERETNGTLDYTPRFTVGLDKVGRLQFSPNTSDADKQLVGEAYEKHLASVTHNDVSHWLCRMMDYCRAVCLRDNGGVYFVPRFNMPVWEAIVGAVRASSGHTVSYVPAMTSGEAVRAILDAMAQEAQHAIEGWNAEVAEGELGARAWRTRQAATEALESKLKAYEGLLGERLDTIRAGLEATQAAIVTALLNAEAASAAE